MNADATAHETRVLLVAPTHRDAQVTHSLLETSGVHCMICADLSKLSQELRIGAGAVILTDTALFDPAIAQVQAVLKQQPAWSDIPTVLLTRDREGSPQSSHALAALSNVTLLDRPASTRSLVSGVKAALRSRLRQYEIRDQLIRQKKAEEFLRNADSRKDEFLATLAHELRNPLAAIFSGVQVLNRSGTADARAERVVGMIDRQSRVLVKLIDELLDVSRITTGKVSLERERHDFRSDIETALETGETLLEAAQHQVQLDLSAGPVWVVGDRSRLAQVVGNLVNNAVKYTPDGGRISIILNEEGGQAVLRVADNGVGIPAEMQSQVFEMFTQVSRTLNRAQGGLGIGLGLVRSLVQLHHGTVEVESPGVGLGSTFTVRLPLASRPLNDDLQASSSSAHQRIVREQLRILVVDDNRDVAQTLTDLLRSEGHQVRTAYSGSEALVAAAEGKPKVIFCDVGMPGIDGHQLAALIRADVQHASVLLVAVTGWGTDEDKRRARRAGFDMHLTKPVTFDDVTKILSKI